MSMRSPVAGLGVPNAHGISLTAEPQGGGALDGKTGPSWRGREVYLSRVFLSLLNFLCPFATHSNSYLP